MFIKWSIFGFLLKQHRVEKTEYRQSRLDDYILRHAQIPVTFNTTNLFYRQQLGIDERHPPIEPDYNETLFRIVANHKKQLVLNYLQNTSVGLYDKLEIINYHKIMNCGESVVSHNITRGGLMRDWDFVM